MRTRFTTRASTKPGSWRPTPDGLSLLRRSSRSRTAARTPSTPDAAPPRKRQCPPGVVMGTPAASASGSVRSVRAAARTPRARYSTSPRPHGGDPGLGGTPKRRTWRRTFPRRPGQPARPPDPARRRRPRHVLHIRASAVGKTMPATSAVIAPPHSDWPAASQPATNASGGTVASTASRRPPSSSASDPSLMLGKPPARAPAARSAGRRRNLARSRRPAGVMPMKPV